MSYFTCTDPTFSFDIALEKVLHSFAIFLDYSGEFLGGVSGPWEIIAVKNSYPTETRSDSSTLIALGFPFLAEVCSVGTAHCSNTFQLLFHTAGKHSKMLVETLGVLSRSCSRQVMAPFLEAGNAALPDIRETFHLIAAWV